MKSGAILASKLAVTIGLFYLILRDIDATTFLAALLHVQPAFLIIVCLLYPVGLVLSAGKLKVSVRSVPS